jgi:hypothetical protein
MKKSQAEVTTAKNLEERFDRREDVLDYFDVAKAKLIEPGSERSIAKAKFAYPVKRKNSRSPAVVREKAANYRKKS